MQPPVLIEYIALILQTIPGPTPQWAAIIGSVVWPVTIAWLAVRFRRPIGRIVERLERRFSDDDIEFGNLLKITRNTRVIALDGDTGSATDHSFVQEQLLEFLSVEDNIDRLRDWLDENIDPATEIVDFITEPNYIDGRRRFYRDMIAGGKNG